MMFPEYYCRLPTQSVLGRMYLLISGKSLFLTEPFVAADFADGDWQTGIAISAWGDLPSVGDGAPRDARGILLPNRPTDTRRQTKCEGPRADGPGFMITRSIPAAAHRSASHCKPNN